MQGMQTATWRHIAIGCVMVCGLIAAWPRPARSDEPAADEPSATAQPSTGQADGAVAKRSLSKDPPGMKRLMPDYDVWIDPKNKRVVVDGTVCLREGQLEMFACPKGTKEHESIVAVDTKAYAVHAGLLALGAQVGTPVEFQPKYKPATGTEIDVSVVWRDRNGAAHNDRAQDWVRNVKTGKAMESPWVFAGSGFWFDEVTKTKHYLAETGDFICVSNFPSAMLDLPVESSQGNDDLLFDAFTERIPPLGTRVRLVLTPKLKK